MFLPMVIRNGSCSITERDSTKERQLVHEMNFFPGSLSVRTSHGMNEYICSFVLVMECVSMLVAKEQNGK